MSAGFSVPSKALCRFAAERGTSNRRNSSKQASCTISKKERFWPQALHNCINTLAFVLLGSLTSASLTPWKFAAPVSSNKNKKKWCVQTPPNRLQAFHHIPYFCPLTDARYLALWLLASDSWLVDDILLTWFIGQWYLSSIPKRMLAQR